MYFFDGDAATRALDGVSFEVRRGEVFGLLGPDGCGKSTTLKLLAGKLKPTEGKAEIFGRSPRRRSIKARIGYAPQIAEAEGKRGFARLMSAISGLFANRARGIGSAHSGASLAG